MKRIFQIIGVIVLISFSFIYTEKAITVVKEYDDIMIKIKEKNKTHKSESMNAVISDNTIIPGISSSKIDINKSYNKMREYGKYNENLMVYKKTLPEISIKNNKDKYIISGNPIKNIISINFLVEKEDNVKQIIDILKINNVKGNFFLKENNEAVIKNISKEDNLIGIYNEYNDWLHTSIKVTSNNEVNYCFDNNDSIITRCSKNNKYTIKTEVIKNNYLIETKKRLKNGVILTFKISDELENELSLIIKHILSKGLNIEKLDILLEE